MASTAAHTRLSLPELERLSHDALREAGASARMARTLAAATVAAERRGRSGVGAAHLLDYLEALRAGRLHGAADPHLEHPRAAVLTVDADGGTAQLAFDRAERDLVEAARACGIALLSTRNSFPAGELAHYAHRLAEAGLVALVWANSPALMAIHGAREAVTGTNPLAFALPHRTGPRVIDQATSATAFVTIREAARRGEPLPEGWALDADGAPTTDPVAALAGVLLPVGGLKGGNLAMMIELLAAMSGGSFSLDAAPFDAGEDSPRLGMMVAAIDPTALDADYSARAEAHLLHLRDRFGIDIGRRKPPRTHVDLPADVLDALRAR